MYFLCYWERTVFNLTGRVICPPLRSYISQVDAGAEYSFLALAMLALAPSIDASAVASQWAEQLGQATREHVAQAFTDLFAGNGWLRDFLCFSWDFRSLEGPAKISSFMTESIDGETRFSHVAMGDITLDTKTSMGPPSTYPVLGSPDGATGVQAFLRFTLQNPARTGRGLVRLVQDKTRPDAPWKAFIFTITAEDIVGQEERVERPLGMWDGHAKTWAEVKAEHIKAVEEDPTVLIMGGGQSGLICAARFGQMGIRSLIIEKTARVGDVWRSRYPNLSLHINSRNCSLLYHPYPKTFPKFLPKDVVANSLEAYAISQNLVIWLRSTALPDPRPVYDEAKKRWTVNIRREHTDKYGNVFKTEVVTLHPTHLVMAMGNGRPRVPQWDGMKTFQGVIYHSDSHNDVEKWAGKKAVVIGACNAAGDVAQSFLHPSYAAASVTMVQRSATCVLSAETLEREVYSKEFSEHIALEDADLGHQSIPNRLMQRMLANGGTQRFKELDKKLLDGLKERGFNLTWQLNPGQGEIGVLGFVQERLASGTMLDVGCAQSIIDGKIKVKSGANVDHFDATGIIFSDGTREEADVVVLATGNRPVIENAIDIFGPDIVSKIGNRIWGLDEEGELINCYRPTGQPGLWFAQGGFSHVRFFSKHLALHIIAEEFGLK